MPIISALAVPSPSARSQTAILWKLALLHIIFESDTTESVRNLIAAGMGIGFWPACSWGPLTTNFGGSPGHFPVKLLPITDQKCRRQIILTRSEKGKKSPIVADFCDFLVEHNNWL